MSFERSRIFIENAVCYFHFPQKRIGSAPRKVISTTPFLTRLARIDRGPCPVSIGATLVKNGDVYTSQTIFFWSGPFGVEKGIGFE